MADTSRFGPVPYTGQITSYLPQRTAPQRSKLTNMQRAGISIPQEVIDAALQARGMEPQQQGGITSLQSMSNALGMPEIQSPFIQDVKSLASGISSGLSQLAANQAETQDIIQAQKRKELADLSPFGGLGEDVTGLQEFGGAGDYTADLAALAQKLASERPKGRGTGEFLRTGAEEGELITSADPESTSTTETSTTETTVSEETTTAGTDASTDEAFDPYGEIVADAMADIERIRDGQASKKDMQAYKDEFAKATGVDISGKANKSQALMAMGLALMQNKAGKGFDVGKMLSAVGEAGEKAMPLMAEARKEAKASQVAAGKYALQQAAAADAKDAATLAAAQARLDDVIKSRADAFEKRSLEILKGNNSMKLERYKQAEETKRAAIKSGADLEKLRFEFTGEKTYTPLTAKPNIKMHIANSKYNGKEVFTKPETDVRLIAKGYADALDGTKSVNDMIDLIETVNRETSGAGGVTGQKLYELVDNKLSAMGIDLGIEYGTGRTLGPLTEAEAIKDRLIAQYKRFLTQETGNGISNTDVERLAASLGTLDFFTNPEEAINKLQETKKIFTSASDALKGALVDYGNRDKYLNPDVYDDVQKIINESALGADTLGLIEQAETKDGITTIKLS